MNKLYLIIINNVSAIEVQKIKNLIGLNELEEKEEVDFMSAQFIWKGYCVGTFNNSLLIVDPYGVFKFYEPIVSDFEYMLCKIVPKSEILVLSLYSVIGSYGFAIIDKGQRVRVRYVGEEKIYFDYGEKLQEEMEIEEEGLAVDGGVVERLFRRVFGKDDREVFFNLNNLKLREYK